MEFLILPKAFVDYVTAFKRIPLATGSQLEDLRSQIEIVCLEVALNGDKSPTLKECDSKRELS